MPRDESTPPGSVLRLTAEQQDRLAQILGDLDVVLRGDVPERWEHEVGTWSRCTDPVDELASEAVHLLLDVAEAEATGHVARAGRRCRHAM